MTEISLTVVSAEREDEPGGLKTDFHASLNPEIRTPLTGILAQYVADETQAANRPRGQSA